ncbi:BstYI methyltransferase [Candidatus Vecturithrix granuli]|uniref:Methyltransferase n=1 Tax=Vecturithrix granuli TaxID=1499967 RepID=A0A081C575_VECG1|nr:BstYI methyltransferase [Candidatus Vecturithrix granuli]
MNLFFNTDSLHIADAYAEQEQIVLYPGDVYEFLQTIPAQSFQLIITSPPYNIGKEYETQTNIQQYLHQQEHVIDQLIRALHPAGSLCWQVGNYVENGEVFPLDIYFYQIFKTQGLKLRNRIIWYFGHGLHASKRFSGRYETLLWFTKSDYYTFNLDAVRIPSKYPGKRHYKGEKKGEISGNPLGKNPSDIWEIMLEEWENGLWDIPNVKSNHPEKTTHPCQFPIELVERCVLALTDEQDRVFDPYCGAASSLIAGLRHHRKVVGCEKEPQYIEIGKQRILDLWEGRLNIRPLGKPVYQPTGREKVAQIPEKANVETSKLDFDCGSRAFALRRGEEVM